MKIAPPVVRSLPEPPARPRGASPELAAFAGSIAAALDQALRVPSPPQAAPVDAGTRALAGDRDPRRGAHGDASAVARDEESRGHGTGVRRRPSPPPEARAQAQAWSAEAVPGPPRLPPELARAVAIAGELLPADLRTAIEGGAPLASTRWAIDVPRPDTAWVRLDDPRLGTIVVEVCVAGGRIDVRMIGESATASIALREMEHELRAWFTARGSELRSVRVVTRWDDDPTEQEGQ